MQIYLLTPPNLPLNKHRLVLTESRGAVGPGRHYNLIKGQKETVNTIIADLMLRESGRAGAGLPRGTLAWLLAVTPATSSAGVKLES